MELPTVVAVEVDGGLCCGASDCLLAAESALPRRRRVSRTLHDCRRRSGGTINSKEEQLRCEHSVSPRKARCARSLHVGPSVAGRRTERK